MLKQIQSISGMLALKSLRREALAFPNPNIRWIRTPKHANLDVITEPNIYTLAPVKFLEIIH